MCSSEKKIGSDGKVAKFPATTALSGIDDYELESVSHRESLQKEENF
jgi:hypothetical protein